MAITNHERVGKALDLLKGGLGPFIEREVRSSIQEHRFDVTTLRRLVDHPRWSDRPVTEWDVAGRTRQGLVTRATFVPESFAYTKANENALGYRPDSCRSTR